jgi:hypothetical protein
VQVYFGNVLFIITFVAIYLSMAKANKNNSPGGQSKQAGKTNTSTSKLKPGQGPEQSQQNTKVKAAKEAGVSEKRVASG